MGAKFKAERRRMERRDGQKGERVARKNEGQLLKPSTIINSTEMQNY